MIKNVLFQENSKFISIIQYNKFQENKLYSYYNKYLRVIWLNLILIFDCYRLFVK